MKNVLLITLCLLLWQCSNKYAVDGEQLTCRFELDHGFELSVLDVKEFNDDGMPTKFNMELKINYIEFHPDLLNKESFSVFKFKEKNGHFKWRIDPFYSDDNSFYDTLPISFAKNKWYLLQLSNQSCFNDDLYFIFKSDDTVEMYHESGNCGASF